MFQVFGEDSFDAVVEILGKRLEAVIIYTRIQTYKTMSYCRSRLPWPQVPECMSEELCGGVE